jgi:protocatechuate 3,4-dioxygenase beta subunit
MGKIIRRSAVMAMGAFLASTAVAAPRRGARPNLYACEGCEAVHEVSPDRLSPSVDLAGADEPGERLILTGRVLSADTRTPVGDVVVYAHHTNAEGLYAKGSNKSEASHRHGRLRGWAKTGPDAFNYPHFFAALIQRRPRYR